MFALSFSVFAPALLGQGSFVRFADFTRMLRDGLRVNSELTRGSSYRFTQTRTIPQPDMVTTTEVSSRGYVRTTVSGNGRSSVAQAVIAGNSIYELSGDGPWTVQTKDEYKAAEAERSAAEKKALAENDVKKYTELRAKYNSAAAAAMRHSMKLMDPAFALGHANQAAVVTYQREETVNGRTLRVYNYNGISPEMLRPGPHELRANVTFWFDTSNGALVKAQTRLDWIYDSKTSTNGWIYEWELDPQIVITSPHTGKAS